MLNALKNGDEIKIHIEVCNSAIPPKVHTVWLAGATVTSVSETSGDDDDFPKENLVWVSLYNIEQFVCTVCKHNYDEYQRQQLEKDILSISNVIDNDELWRIMEPTWQEIRA